jgi:hypothetical protein
MYVCAAAAAAVRCLLAGRRHRRTTEQLRARVHQAAEDRAFVLWATWTMLSVTDRDGMIRAATLRQLYTTGQYDQVWDAPIAVSIWHGDPDVVQRWETELHQENHG